MSSIRPEVVAFVRAAQRLLTLNDQAASLPLSDDETEKLVEYLTKLEQNLKDLEQKAKDADDLLKVIAQVGGLPLAETVTAIQGVTDIHKDFLGL